MVEISAVEFDILTEVFHGIPYIPQAYSTYLETGH
jgi:hypothetical protein